METRQTLDKMKCDNPACTETHPLTLHSVCHPHDPTWTHYDSSDGEMPTTPISQAKTMDQESLVERLRIRAHIRRHNIDRKSVREGKPDRIADLLEEAANKIEELEIKFNQGNV